MLREAEYATQSFFIGIYEQKTLLAYALLEKRTIGLGQYGFFVIGGPVGQDDKKIQEALSGAIQELTKKERVIFVQIEPLSLFSLPYFKTGHYKDFIEKHTAVIDLTQDEETILARMKQKGRYNIRVAEKSGVIVEQVASNPENLDIFYRLLTETTERDRFAANSPEYFQTFLTYLEKNKLGGLSFARREGEVIAAGIFVFSGKTALYYYGASSSDNAKRKYMATYLLQWEMIHEAKKRWCEIFDFLGIAAPESKDSHLAWVTDFKLKLTPETKQWPESQIYIMKRWWWLVLKLVRKIKRR